LASRTASFVASNNNAALFSIAVAFGFVAIPLPRLGSNPRQLHYGK